eukprot:3867197-Alexandrium_andersonii.AAC.1
MAITIVTIIVHMWCLNLDGRSNLHPCSTSGLARSRGFGPLRSPLSSADSDSARTEAQRSPLRSFGEHARGCFWARAVEALKA